MPGSHLIVHVKARAKQLSATANGSDLTRRVKKWNKSEAGTKDVSAYVFKERGRTEMKKRKHSLFSRRPICSRAWMPPRCSLQNLPPFHAYALFRKSMLHLAKKSRLSFRRNILTSRLEKSQGHCRAPHLPQGTASVHPGKTHCRRHTMIRASWPYHTLPLQSAL